MRMAVRLCRKLRSKSKMSKIAERQVVFGIFLCIAELEIDGIIERSDKCIEKVAEIYSKREFVQQAVAQNGNKYRY